MGLSLRLLARKHGWQIGRFIPFSHMNTVWRSMDKSRSLLDVACGWGGAARLFRKKFDFILGLDCSKEAITGAKNLNSHDAYIYGDVSKGLNFIRSGTFDVVFNAELMEHLTREEALNLISEMERVARKRVVRCIPIRAIDKDRPRPSGKLDAGHITRWEPKDFVALGYKVKGAGFPLIKGRTLAFDLPIPLRPLGYLLYFLASPISYFFPYLGMEMVCIKDCDSHEKKD